MPEVRMDQADPAVIRLASLEAAVEISDDAVLCLDGDGRVVRWNPRALRLLGLSASALRAAPLHELFADEDRATWERCWRRLRAGIPIRLVELAVCRLDESRVPVRLSAAVARLDGGDPQGFCVILRDLTEQHLAQTTLAFHAERLAENEALANVGSWAWDAGSDTVQWSLQQHRIHGLEPHEFDGTFEGHLAAVHSRDRGAVAAAMRRALRSGVPLERTFRVVRPDGSVRWVNARATRVEEPGSTGSGLRGIYHDLTDSYQNAEALQRSNARLQQLALYDDLTGLANRGLFLERLKHALEGRDPAELVVCFLDLDDFKAVNDLLGHAAGDSLLRIIGNRLRSCLRPSDTAARFGGDEFAVMLEQTGLDEAHAIVQRLLGVVSEPVRLEGTHVVVHTSIGLAPTGGRLIDPEQLLAQADAAVYAAKARGGQRIEVFADEMRDAIERRSRVRSEIEGALAHGEFFVEYQSIVDLRTGAWHGAEALVRWQHPQHGLLRPLDFIDEAEASGQITAIDRWVFAHACRLVRELPPEAVLSVNVSARQLQQPDLVAFVQEVLQQAGTPAQRLVLEVTETAAVTDAEATVGRLHELRSLGLKIALDDFGTGYSPLGNLREYPVDYLKIDRSFVRGMVRSAADRAIVGAVIDMAQALSLCVVAEGVEDVEQRDLLTALGCDLGQGYLWGESVPPDQLLRLAVPRPRAPRDLGSTAAARRAGRRSGGDR
jgi:diguanylate cyclase (GGDEF)-like protein/PAS domain S-box-containing protein